MDAAVDAGADDDVNLGAELNSRLAPSTKTKSVTLNCPTQENRAH